MFWTRRPGGAPGFRLYGLGIPMALPSTGWTSALQLDQNINLAPLLRGWQGCLEKSRHSRAQRLTAFLFVCFPPRQALYALHAWWAWPLIFSFYYT